MTRFRINPFDALLVLCGCGLSWCLAGAMGWL